MSADRNDLRERVRRVPGMERLLPALDGLEPAYLVGGAVRDLVRGAVPNDVDIAVEGDARSVARAVAERLGSDAREYERFGTATVETPTTSYNFATTREEVYDSPGELPRVSPASLVDDLRRRDFSINAMAVGLTGDDLGHLYDPTGGLPDMEARLVRVLHERSFLDDPTRLLRAVRYAVRLDFALDPETERLAREAVAGDALSTVSGARIRDELMDLLGELDAPAAIRRMRELEIHTGLHPELDPDPDVVASASLGAVAIGADRGIAALAALIEEAPEKLDLWLGDLHLAAEQRDAASRAARVAPRIAAALREREHAPSELRGLLAKEPPEALALALALGAPSEPILRWVSELRPVALEISGADLLAAGVPEGPAVGRALDETLNRKLDGLVSGREAELETALLLAQEHAQ
jgi:tRNA nucleotidyltransferase (CCA-adding enzyme)